MNLNKTMFLAADVKSLGWLSVLMITVVIAYAGSTMLAADASRSGAKQAVVAVKGLACPVCAHRLQKVLKALPGAEDAKVELAKNEAVIDFASDSKITNQQIQDKVKDAGFVPGKIEWRTKQ